MRMQIKKYRQIITIIAVFLIIKFLTLNLYKIIWWDPAVNIGIGKYIYSFGSAGLWESSRTLVWPLMLGLLWKTGLNVFFAGRILDIIFGALCILMAYLIGERLFDKKSALLTSLLLALSPTFFFFNGIMLTETSSTFFALAAIYFFITDKYFISGCFFGIAFMARFLQLFAFIAAILPILLYHKNRIKNLKRIFLGFAIASAPFFIINLAMYHNPFFPFLQQVYLSVNSGWVNYHQINYYFIELLKENSLYLLFVFGIFLIFKNHDKNKKIIPIAFLPGFIFFNLIKQKEMRFLIILFPYMYLLISYGIVYLLDKLKNNLFKKIICILIILSFILSGAQAYEYFKSETAKINQYLELQAKLESDNVKGKIWISSPIIPVFSSKKISYLMYYPVFNEEKKNEIESLKPDFIFLDSCDFACRQSDSACENNKKDLISNLKGKLNEVYSSKADGCEQYIFKK